MSKQGSAMFAGIKAKPVLKTIISNSADSKWLYFKQTSTGFGKSKKEEIKYGVGTELITPDEFSGIVNPGHPAFNFIQSELQKEPETPGEAIKIDYHTDFESLDLVTKLREEEQKDQVAQLATQQGISIDDSANPFMMLNALAQKIVNLNQSGALKTDQLSIDFLKMKLKIEAPAEGSLVADSTLRIYMDKEGYMISSMGGSFLERSPFGENDFAYKIINENTTIDQDNLIGFYQKDNKLFYKSKQNPLGEEFLPDSAVANDYKGEEFKGLTNVKKYISDQIKLNSSERDLYLRSNGYINSSGSAMEDRKILKFHKSNFFAKITKGALYEENPLGPDKDKIIPSRTEALNLSYDFGMMQRLPIHSVFLPRATPIINRPQKKQVNLYKDDQSRALLSLQYSDKVAEDRISSYLNKTEKIDIEEIQLAEDKEENGKVKPGDLTQVYGSFRKSIIRDTTNLKFFTTKEEFESFIPNSKANGTENIVPVFLDSPRSQIKGLDGKKYDFDSDQDKVNAINQQSIAKEKKVIIGEILDNRLDCEKGNEYKKFVQDSLKKFEKFYELKSEMDEILNSDQNKLADNRAKLLEKMNAAKREMDDFLLKDNKLRNLLKEATYPEIAEASQLKKILDEKDSSKKDILNAFKVLSDDTRYNPNKTYKQIILQWKNCNDLLDAGANLSTTLEWIDTKSENKSVSLELFQKGVQDGLSEQTKQKSGKAFKVFSNTATPSATSTYKVKPDAKVQQAQQKFKAAIAIENAKAKADAEKLAKLEAEQAKNNEILARKEAALREKERKLQELSAGTSELQGTLDAATDNKPAKIKTATQIAIEEKRAKEEAKKREELEAAEKLKAEKEAARQAEKAANIKKLQEERDTKAREFEEAKREAERKKEEDKQAASEKARAKADQMKLLNKPEGEDTTESAAKIVDSLGGGSSRKFSISSQAPDPSKEKATVVETEEQINLRRALELEQRSKALADQERLTELKLKKIRQEREALAASTITPGDPPKVNEERSSSPSIREGAEKTQQNRSNTNEPVIGQKTSKFVKKR